MAQRADIRQNDDGGVLVEFALVLPLFLVMLMAVIDFGQIYLRWILAEKATDLVARFAVVRPPICPGVPIFNDRTPGIPKTSPFGTSCTASFFDLCENPGVVTCTGASATGDSFGDIFDAVNGLLPAGIEPENISFTYSFANLGFLGGPYVPLVSVELTGDVAVPYFTPLGPLLQTFYGGSGFGDLILPPMRATLPAEDLSEGGPG
ncbi:MAG: TadE family protein [Pseudomonadota bacterium]